MEKLINFGNNLVVGAISLAIMGGLAYAGIYELTHKFKDIPQAIPHDIFTCICLTGFVCTPLIARRFQR